MAVRPARIRTDKSGRRYAIDRKGKRIAIKEARRRNKLSKLARERRRDKRGRFAKRRIVKRRRIAKRRTVVAVYKRDKRRPRKYATVVRPDGSTHRQEISPDPDVYELEVEGHPEPKEILAYLDRREPRYIHYAIAYMEEVA